MQRVKKNVASLAIIVALTAAVVSGVTRLFFPQEAIGLWFTLGIAVFFFVCDSCILLMGNMVMERRKMNMVTFYLATKTVRLLLAVGLLFLYILLGLDHVVMFVIQLLLFYLVTLLYTNACLIKSEALNKKKV